MNKEHGSHLSSNRRTLSFVVIGLLIGFMFGASVFNYVRYISQLEMTVSPVRGLVVNEAIARLFALHDGVVETMRRLDEGETLLLSSEQGPSIQYDASIFSDYLDMEEAPRAWRRMFEAQPQGPNLVVKSSNGPRLDLDQNWFGMIMNPSQTSLSSSHGPVRQLSREQASLAVALPPQACPQLLNHIVGINVFFPRSDIRNDVGLNYGDGNIRWLPRTPGILGVFVSTPSEIARLCQDNPSIFIVVRRGHVESMEDCSQTLCPTIPRPQATTGEEKPRGFWGNYVNFITRDGSRPY